jgi:hypothetical protein
MIAVGYVGVVILSGWSSRQIFPPQWVGIVLTSAACGASWVRLRVKGAAAGRRARSQVFR